MSQVACVLLIYIMAYCAPSPGALNGDTVTFFVSTVAPSGEYVRIPSDFWNRAEHLDSVWVVREAGEGTVAPDSVSIHAKSGPLRWLDGEVGLVDLDFAESHGGWTRLPESLMSPGSDIPQAHGEVLGAFVPYAIADWVKTHVEGRTILTRIAIEVYAGAKIVRSELDIY